MPEVRALISTLSGAVRIQLHSYEVGEVLDALTEDTAEALGVIGAGLALGDDRDKLRFVTATDEMISRLESWQEDRQQGPCQEAYREGRQTIIEHLDADHGRREFAHQSLALGIRSVASFPMSTDDSPLGALTLYSDQPRGWNEPLVEAAQLLADLATLYIVNQRKLDASQTLTQHLQKALDSRIVVEQAKGIIAERKRTDPATAFGYLRRHSRNTNTSIHKVARLVVGGRLEL